MKATDCPLRKTMCATCPFRAGSPYAHLVPELTQRALIEASRICHSTGTNIIGKRTGIKPHLCRGARDVQLSVFSALQMIESPTDEAWNERRVQIGMKPTTIKNPSQE